jgi:hypothetical protein
MASSQVLKELDMRAAFDILILVFMSQLLRSKLEVVTVVMELLKGLGTLI